MSNAISKLRLLSLLLTLVVAYGAIGRLQIVTAWSDGGYSIDSNNIRYGTHDWIAEHALALLPSNESGWLTSNRNVFLFGTEAPENDNASFKGRNGYGDVEKHHNYYTGAFPRDCFDDSASVRAEEEYQKALLCLKNGSYDLAAWYAGAMSHYIADLGSWPHVIADATPTHASKYEKMVSSVTDNYSKDPGYITFPQTTELLGGSSSVTLETHSAYDAALWLGIGIYSDAGGWHSAGPYPAVQMDANFQDSWSSVDDMPPTYRQRVGFSIGLTVVTVADVLHTLTVEAELTGEPSGSTPSQPFALAIALVSIAVFGAAVVIAASAYFRHKRPSRWQNGFECPLHLTSKDK